MRGKDLILILILLSPLIFFSGCVEEEETVYMEFKPVQCLQNPWEQDWLERHGNRPEFYPLERETEVFSDYYAKKGFSFYSVELVPSYELVCQSCDCPRGDLFKVLVDKQAASDLNALGFSPEEVEEALVDSSTAIQIELKQSNELGLDDRLIIYNSGFMERVFTPSQAAETSLFEGNISRLRLEEFAASLLKKDFFSFEELFDCGDCPKPLLTTILTVSIGSKSKTITLRSPEFLPSELEAILSQLKSFKLIVREVLSQADKEFLVGFLELVERAEGFDGNYVCVKGQYLLASEYNVLKNKTPIEEIEKGRYPAEIWIANPNLFEKTNCTELDVNAFPWRSCYAIICGKFEFNDQGAFGADRSFKYQLSKFE